MGVGGSALVFASVPLRLGTLDTGCNPSACQQHTSDGRAMDGLGSRCKIVVVGDTQCGKTALLHVFAKDCYPEVGPYQKSGVTSNSTSGRVQQVTSTCPKTELLNQQSAFWRQNYDECL